MTDVARDTATGISIRFVKQFDIHTDKHPRHFDAKIPADWLTTDVRAMIYGQPLYLGFMFI